MATADRERVQRFGRTERAFHWVHASAFLVLLGSGLCMYLPSLAEEIGRRPLLKAIHLYTALAWAIALVLIIAVGDRRRLRATLREVEYFDADDRDWLLARRAPQGRFNAGQKLNTIVTAAFAILFAISGFFLWYGERNTTFQNPNALLLHDWLTYASLILFLGHLYLTLIYPKTRHSLSGMTRGWVREDWALKHHPKWVAAESAGTSAAVSIRQPRAFSPDQDSDVVVIDLRYGETLDNDPNGDQAVIEVIAGRILVQSAGEAAEFEPGTRVTFGPGQQCTVRALSDVLLLFDQLENGSATGARLVANATAQSRATPVVCLVALLGLVLLLLLAWQTRVP